MGYACDVTNSVSPFICFRRAKRGDRPIWKAELNLYPVLYDFFAREHSKAGNSWEGRAEGTPLLETELLVGVGGRCGEYALQ